MAATRGADTLLPVIWNSLVALDGTSFPQGGWKAIIFDFRPNARTMLHGNCFGMIRNTLHLSVTAHKPTALNLLVSPDPMNPLDAALKPVSVFPHSFRANPKYGMEGGTRINGSEVESRAFGIAGGTGWLVGRHCLVWV